MLIIGCDFHPSFEQIAFCDTITGECGQRRLEHGGEAEAFYRSLQGAATPNCCSTCCSSSVSRGSPCLRRSSAICGSWSDIGIVWCRCRPA